jgi:uncharacterized protein (TIGR02246 family)
MPKRLSIVHVVRLATLITIASGPALARQGGVRAAIDAANEKFSEGGAKGDAALLASVYTSDAEAFPPNADVVGGREAIQKMWQSVLDMGINGITLKTRDVESAGDLAYESGSYEMRTKDGNVADRGKYCVVSKRVQGQWRLHRDIWNTSMPPAPAR